MFERRFDGKVAVVTGAASGIGFATAKRLALEGAQVIAFDKDKKRLERFNKLPDISTQTIDIGDMSQVKGSVADILGKYGCIDVLINSAAMFDMTPLDEASDTAVEKSRRINVLGTSSVLNEVAETMIAKHVRGSIVNIASVSGMGQEAQKTVYSKTKAEILDITIATAARLGQYGIRVNTISPGPIFTEASFKHMEQIGVDEATFKKGAETGTLLGRMGEPEEVASAILFLASDEASYITGVNLVVDGGFNVVLQTQANS